MKTRTALAGAALLLAALAAATYVAGELREVATLRSFDADGAAHETQLWIVQPFNGLDASAGNGTMLGLAASTRAQVDAVHAAALAGGGRDEGRPGLRESYGPNYYAAYFRDLDGNKLSVVCRSPE